MASGVAKAAGDLRAYFDLDVTDIPDRRLYDASKEGMLAVAEMWDREYKMRHFTEEAAARYHYAPRTAKYLRRKARLKNHQIPLMWSKETISAARTHGFGRAYPTRVTMQLPTPSYIRMVPRAGGNHPPLGDELTRTSPDEVEALEARYHDVVEALIQSYMEGKGNYQGLARRMA